MNLSAVVLPISTAIYTETLYVNFGEYIPTAFPQKPGHYGRAFEFYIAGDRLQVIGFAVSFDKLNFRVSRTVTGLKA